MVFEITEEELANSDQYEPEPYTRITAMLASGNEAWIYVGARHKPRAREVEMKAEFKTAKGYQGDNMNLPVENVETAIPFYETIMVSMFCRVVIRRTSRRFSAERAFKSDWRKTAEIPRRTAALLRLTAPTWHSLS